MDTINTSEYIILDCPPEGREGLTVCQLYSEDEMHNWIFVVTSLRHDTRMECVLCVCCSPVTPDIMNHPCLMDLECERLRMCVSMCV